MPKAAKSNRELTSWTGNGALVEVIQVALTPMIRVKPTDPTELNRRARSRKTAETIELTQGTEGVESRAPNAASRAAIDEIKIGKLKRYADEDELFLKLGIKIGKS
jgi:hypothetical protein